MQKPGDELLFLDCSNEIIDAFIAAQNRRIGQLTRQEKNKLRIVCSPSLKHQQLRNLSDDDRPTLLVGILASEVTLGPLQMHRRSVCLACLQHWAVVADWQKPQLPASSAQAKLINLALRLTNDAVQQFERCGSIPELEGSLTMVNGDSGISTVHPIFPRADCPACGSIQNRQFRDLSVHCSPVTGIVKHIKCFAEPMAGAFQALALFMSSPPVAGTPRSVETAWGRGMSAQQARNSCIGEAIESYSVAYRGDELMTKATLADIPGAIDPRNVLLYSRTQYETRDLWNKVLPERHIVPEPFDPAQPIDWLAAKDLTDDTAVWLPAACCLVGYPFHEGAQKFAVATRAGCASGMHHSDALLGALLELVEHDAVAIWWYNQIKRPAIQLESFASPSLLLIRDALQRVGRGLFLLDVTTDLKIPTYVAVSTMIGGTQLLFGAAAHYSPRIAAESAATEVSQRWLCSHIARMPSDFFPWISSGSLANQPHCKPTHEIDAPPEPRPLTSSAITQLCIQRLNSIGVRAVAVDLSRPDVLLHTVRVIAQGLRPVSNRRAPGRLYDVPAQLGWSDMQRTEAQLNPTCCVF